MGKERGCCEGFGGRYGAVRLDGLMEYLCGDNTDEEE